MNQWQREAEFARNADFDYFLLAGRYTLWSRNRSTNICPCVWRKGSASFSAASSTPAFWRQGAFPPRSINIDQPRRKSWQRRGGSKPSALQFPLAHPAVRSLVVGMIAPTEVDQNLAALHAPIPAAFWTALLEQGLIDPAAPIPM